MMKNNSVYLLAVLFVCSTFNLKAQTSEEYFKTLQKRVNTTGEIPSQTRYNLYVDKMNKLFYTEKWKDEVISMKQLRVEPVDKPSNWYYLVSVKTKNCSTPWYIEYNISDPTLGEILRIISAPAEYNAFIETQNKAQMSHEELLKKVDDEWFTVVEPIALKVNTLIINNETDIVNRIDSMTLTVPENERAARKKLLLNYVAGLKAYKDLNYAVGHLDIFTGNKSAFRIYLEKNDWNTSVQKLTEECESDTKKEIKEAREAIMTSLKYVNPEGL
jgi:hypothetical protein